MTTLKRGDTVWVKARLTTVDDDSETAFPYEIALEGCGPVWCAAEDVTSAPPSGVLNERRERIATAALQGSVASPNTGTWQAEHHIDFAVRCADALIAALEEP